MKKQITVVLCVLSLVAVSVSPLSAQDKEHFWDQFLSRYRPSPVTLPPGPGRLEKDLADRARSGELPVTVSDVVTLTLANNVDIAANRLPSLSAEFAELSANRPFERQVNLGASLKKLTTPADTQFFAANNKYHTERFNLGVSQALQNGTDVGVDLSLNRLSSNNPFATFNPSWFGNVTYSFTKHLLRNNGRPINTRQIRVAQNNRQISAIEFEEDVIDLIVQAQKTYWDLVFGVEDIKVKQHSMELAQKILADNQVELREGALAGVDLVQPQSEVASRKEAVIVANYRQTVSENQIKKLITSQIDPGLVRARLNPMQRTRTPQPQDLPDAESAVRTALENRPELRLLSVVLKNKDIDAEYAKNQLMPTVDLNGQFSHNGLGGVLTTRQGFGGPPIGVIPGGIIDSFGQVVQVKNRGYELGINVQIPLGNRAAQADNDRAAVEKRITEARVQTTSQQIALEVRNALAAVEMNRARVDAAREAREFAERTLTFEQTKRQSGASTVRIVLEEQRNVTQAQTNEVAALVDYSKALVDLDRAMGVTLKKNNVEIEKALHPAAQ